MTPENSLEQAPKPRTIPRHRYSRYALVVAAVLFAASDRSPIGGSSNNLEASSSRGQVDPQWWASLPTRTTDVLNSTQIYNIGILITGPNPQQLSQDFLNSGWVEPDKYTLGQTASDVLGMADLACKNKPYPTAPLEPQHLYNEPPTLGFVKQGSKVTDREEIRIWQAPHNDPETNNPIYLVSAVHDVDLVRPSSKTFCRTRLAFSGKLSQRIIEPNVDLVRQSIEAQFKASKQFVASRQVAGTKPYSAALNSDNNLLTDGLRVKIDLQPSNQ